MLRRAASLAAPTAIALAVASLAVVSVLWADGGGSVSTAWAPSLDLNLSFSLDGLGALYCLLASGIGLAVFTYSWKHMPEHLSRQSRPRTEEIRFYALLVLFMLSMIGLATAQDLIVLFVFWDLTAISSYFLIAYDRHEADSRVAALTALLITGVTAILLLIGSLVLYVEYGTFSIPELAAAVEPGTTLTIAALLIAIAGLAKSAQVPFQFWLPRAMAAPTPVSAYLHSAAMVAAGVLLIGRAYPLIEQSRLVLDVLLVVGGLSILVGGLLALARDNLKQLLAYSTISQYGYVVVMYGLGGGVAAAAAAFYVISHAIAKSGLFMTAGAVTDATDGRKALSEVGGLLRPMPLLAAASGAAVAAVIALPLTLGFFADELFFKAALERGDLAALFAVLAAGLTFAYLGRFWTGVFLGPLRAPARRVQPLMIAPIVVLGACALLGGLVPGPVADLAAKAGESSTLAPTTASVAYHLDLRTENLMALSAWGLGLLVILSLPRTMPALAAFARLGSRFGSERIYGGTVARLNRVSDRIHDLEVRDLRTRIAAVLMPGGILVVLGVIATPTAGAYVVGDVEGREIGLILMLMLAALTGLAVTVPRNHLTLVLTLATVGYSLAGVYAFFGAPDVALVAVIVETIFALLFIGIFSLMPASVLRREAVLPTTPQRRRRDAIVGVISGGVAFIVAWGALSRPTPEESIASEHLDRASDAHAQDVVTAILADFRALDTMGEITVVAVAFIGVATLLRRGRIW